jgi:hypothetical protein
MDLLAIRGVAHHDHPAAERERVEARLPRRAADHVVAAAAGLLVDGRGDVPAQDDIVVAQRPGRLDLARVADRADHPAGAAQLRDLAEPPSDPARGSVYEHLLACAQPRVLVDDDERGRGVGGHAGGDRELVADRGLRQRQRRDEAGAGHGDLGVAPPSTIVSAATGWPTSSPLTPSPSARTWPDLDARHVRQVHVDDPRRYSTSA